MQTTFLSAALRSKDVARARAESKNATVRCRTPRTHKPNHFKWALDNYNHNFGFENIGLSIIAR